MIRLPKKKSHLAEEIFIDVTPLVDVMLILLLFFLLMVNVTQHVYPVNLPQSDPSFKEAVELKDPIKVTIFKGGKFAIDTKKYPDMKSAKEALIDKLQNNKQTKVVVIPDSKSDSGTLIALLTFFEGNQIENVDILVEDGA
jgi:biopolymer transport protein ExbD